MSDDQTTDPAPNPTDVTELHPSAGAILASPLFPGDDTGPTLGTRDARATLGLMTEDEFGRAVGVSGKTVALWRQHGEGPPYFKFKRNIFYRTADITQWLIENIADPVTGEPIVPKPQPIPKHPPPLDTNNPNMDATSTRSPDGTQVSGGVTSRQKDLEPSDEFEAPEP